MATDDCVVIGRGACPCGKGEISVERCTPDHPWVKAHQVSYGGSIECPDCQKAYGFEGNGGNRPPRLVEQTGLKAKNAAGKASMAAAAAIRESSEFQGLQTALDERLATEASAAARHRLACSTMQPDLMLDTNVFNHVLDGRIGAEALVGARLGSLHESQRHVR